MAAPNLSFNDLSNEVKEDKMDKKPDLLSIHKLSLSPVCGGLMNAAKSLNSLSPKHLSLCCDIPPLGTLSLQRSTGITKGFFVTNIMKKIEKGNSLDLTKINIAKQNIGRGAAAFVHYAKYNHFEIALKEYKFEPDNFNDDTLSKFENELNILKLLKHDNIIKLLGYHLNINKKVLTFAFEYSHHGNLFNMIHPINIKQSDYSYYDILNMLLYIAKGMKHLHSKRIIHRDLNPRNVLIFDDTLKITDVGESLFVDKDQDFEKPQISDKMSIGTAGYKAAEMIKIRRVNGYSCYNYKIDVFSFGSICYEMITRDFVSSKQYLKRYDDLRENTHCLLIPEDANDFGQLIYECWHFDPNQRPSFPMIVDKLNELIQKHKNSDNGNQ